MPASAATERAAELSRAGVPPRMVPRHLSIAYADVIAKAYFDKEYRRDVLKGTLNTEPLLSPTAEVVRHGDVKTAVSLGEPHLRQRPVTPRREDVCHVRRIVDVDLSSDSHVGLRLSDCQSPAPEASHELLCAANCNSVNSSFIKLHQHLVSTDKRFDRSARFHLLHLYQRLRAGIDVTDQIIEHWQKQLPSSPDEVANAICFIGKSNDLAESFNNQGTCPNTAVQLQRVGSELSTEVITSLETSTFGTRQLASQRSAWST